MNTGSDARPTAGVGVGLAVQTTFRPGERITQKFTKDNPAAWCNYFDQICLRYNILSNDALISCLDADSLAVVQPILGPNVPYAQVKQLLLDTYTAEVESSRTHFEGLGFEASSPRKLLCPRLEDSTIF